MNLPAISPTAKAYVGALVTFLGTVLAATLPFVDGPVSVAITVALSVLASYGAVYAVPNKNYPQHPRRP